MDNWSFDLEVPFAEYRNRLRSVSDKKLSNLSGTDIHGDAAFADHMVTASLSHKF